MLADPALLSSVISAHTKTTWELFSVDFAKAINTYILSGTVTTNVTGATATGTITGIGIGTITNTTLPALTSAISLACKSVLWSVYVTQVVTAIDVYVKACTVNTTVSSTAVGTGVGVAGCIVTSAGKTAFEASLQTLYASTNDWPVVSSQFCKYLKIWVQSFVVTTTDSGSSPLPWSGGGVGAIT